MAHALITGRTETGKTTLAKALCGELTAGGHKTLVYDVLKSAWPASYVTDDKELFLDVFWQSTDLAVFIDEGGESVGRFDEEMMKTATRGRHNGHQVFYLSQRVTLLNKTLRTQATKIYVFSSAFSDCKLLADDYSCPEIEQAANFAPGSFLYVNAAQRVAQRFKIDFSTKRVILDTGGEHGQITDTD